MAGASTPRTLFYLMPMNELAFAALEHPKNKPYESLNKGKPGLEIGFHVQKVASIPIITAIGRKGDLYLHGTDISKSHISFEVQRELEVVLLVRRCLSRSSVKIATEAIDQAEYLENSHVVNYGQEYLVHIGGYHFSLQWNSSLSDLEHRSKTLREYDYVEKNAGHVDFEDLPTDRDGTEANNWYNTALRTQAKTIHEIPGRRKRLGAGGFGKVFSTIEVSGKRIAVKTIKISAGEKGNRGRAMTYREIQAMKRLKHPHIIELLGDRGWSNDTCLVEICMPLKAGDTMKLAKTGACTVELSRQILHEILQALDFLSVNNQCHRDVKPKNILCHMLGTSSYRFQLADFGLVRHSDEIVSSPGTQKYKAPELYMVSDANPTRLAFRRGTKMDVWPLFVTFMELDPSVRFPTASFGSIQDVSNEITRLATEYPEYGRMGIIDPEKRASAAEMLVACFNGEGLTTKLEMIPNIISGTANGQPHESHMKAGLPAYGPANDKQDDVRNNETLQSPASPGSVPKRQAPFHSSLQREKLPWELRPKRQQNYAPIGARGGGVSKPKAKKPRRQRQHRAPHPGLQDVSSNPAIQPEQGPDLGQS